MRSNSGQIGYVTAKTATSSTLSPLSVRLSFSDIRNWAVLQAMAAALKLTPDFLQLCGPDQLGTAAGTRAAA